ncbi:MAG: hypothetical protein JXQ29_18770 [Planctomycetes bacterium]|nr:hypothetical protein [Planctomycetota bacterium]
MNLPRCLPALLLAVLLLAAGGAAQRLLYVPDANADQGTCNGVPFQGSSEWRYQMMISAGQLGSVPVRIHDVAFAPCLSGTFTAAQFEMRMAHNPSGRLSATLDGNLAANRTVVYQGAIRWTYATNQWSPIGCSQHFDFNGRDSVIVEIRYAAGQGGATFRRDASLPRAYTYGAGAFNATQAALIETGGGLKVRLTVQDIFLTGSGTGAPGTAYSFVLVSRADPGRAYQMGTALGAGPVSIGSRWLHLSPDALLVASTSNQLPAVFSAYVGLLDGGGTARAALHVPAVPQLTGLTLYTAFVVLDPQAPFGIQEISNTLGFRIP